MDLVDSVLREGKTSKEVEKEEDSSGGSDRIKIVTAGIGGGGNNTINRLIKSGVKGTDLVAINTDKQHLTMLP